MKVIKTYLLSEKTYSFLISAFLVSLPLRYAYSNTVLIVLLAVSLCSVFYHKIEFNKELLLPIAIYIFMILSLFWTVDMSKSVRGLERQVSFLLVPLAFILMPKISIKVVLQSFYVFSIFLAGLVVFLLINSFFLFIANANKEVFFYHTLVKPLNLNAIYMSVMTSLSLLFIIFYSKKNLLNWIITAILFMFLILLTSKNVIIITIVCILIGLFLSKKVNIKRIVFIFIFVMGSLSILFFSPLKNRLTQEFSSDLNEILSAEKFTKIYPWTGSTIRLFQARIAYELLEENDKFLTGFGINASQDKVVSKQNEYNLYFGYNTYNFHNQFIQSFVELGLLGFLFIIMLLVGIFKKYLSQKELIILFFFIVMTSIFLTESYIWRQRGMLHFLVIYGLLIKFFQSNKDIKKLNTDSNL